MVEPLFSTTSTGAEVWLVLCELSPSHPGVDVYAHMCWKWTITHLCWPLRCAELGEMSVTCTTFCNIVWLQWSRPWWLNHCFPPHLQELRCGWFYLSCVFHILVWMCFLWCSLVLEVEVNLYGLTTSMCRVGWMVCVWPVPISAVCLIAVDVNPDGWTTNANDCSVIDLGVALSRGKLTLLPQSLLERSDEIWP
jgi:hypothetical protein